MISKNALKTFIRKLDPISEKDFRGWLNERVSEFEESRLNSDDSDAEIDQEVNEYRQSAWSIFHKLDK